MAVEKARCEVCGVEYEYERKSGPKRKICFSKDCRNKRSNASKLKIKHQCGQCGKEFERSNLVKSKTGANFCSRACAKKYQSDNREYRCKCIICGSEFLGYTSRAKLCDNKECKKQHERNKANRYYREKNPPSTTAACLHCGKKFKRESARQTFCSKRCRDDAGRERRKYDRSCELCGNEFRANAVQRFCSSLCVGLARRQSHEEFVTLQCKGCGKDYLVKHVDRNRRKYCSLECVYKYSKVTNPDVVLVCENCGVEYEIPYERRKNTRPGKPRRFCSIRCANKVNRNGDREWTPEQRKKASDSHRGKKLSEETKKKMSVAASRRILNGDYNIFNSFKSGWHKSPKMNDKFWYRSSWEQKVFKYLDNDKGIAAYHPESLVIPYTLEGSHHNYHPDILIELTSGKSLLVEIKPENQVPWPKNQAKYTAAKAYCRERGINFSVWTEKELERRDIL